MCQTVKLSVHYSSCALKFFIGSRIFSKKIGIFPTFFFSWNGNKIKINFIFWLLLCFKELIWTKNNYWNKTSTHTLSRFRKLHMTVLFCTTCYKVFGLKISLYLEGSRLFKLYLFLAKAREKIKSKKAWTFSIKRKFLSKHCEPT